MKAVVFRKIGQVELEDIYEPILQEATDAIIKVVASSICGTDLHMVRGTMSGMRSGTVLGHEGVGIVEEAGSDVRSVNVGDRVVVCSTIACGECVFCKAEEYSSCAVANPNGPDAGTAFFGGPELSGPFDGLQAERARIPFADAVLVPIPESVSNEDALLCSDIFPTGYMGAEIADVKKGDMVAVFGCGPVGQMTIASAKMLGAGKVFAIDCKPDRLAMAERQGAIAINYEEADPVRVLRELTNSYGPDACIDAVGVDAQRPHGGPASHTPIKEKAEHLLNQKLVAPKAVKFGDQWRQGDGPGQVITWCVEAVRKSGVVSIIGVYPEAARFFPIGLAMQKALTVRAANCSHRKYVPMLLKYIENNQFHPSAILTAHAPLNEAVACYRHFDKREPGWIKVGLEPAA